MRRIRILVVAATLVAGVIGPAAPAPAATPGGGMDPATAAAYATKTCGGIKPMDTALANRLNPLLNGKLRGYLTGYRMSCARRVVETVRGRGLARRAAAIAVTTTIVESTIENISEEVDHDSLGLFQQRASWGTAAQRTDPVWATNAFLNRMIALYPNNAWNNTTTAIGGICQRVQVSAFPDAYQVQASDGSTIAYNILDALAGRAHRPGVFRPGANDWIFRGAGVLADWGVPGDLPVAGDWDGDGVDQPGVFRPSEKRWYLHGGGHVDDWGEPGDRPVAGDWDGDGRDEPGVFRPSEKRWYLLGNGRVENWGEPNDLPVAGDWNGDGKDEPGVFRPGANDWFLRGSGGLADWGLPGDQPVAGDWNGDGIDEPGVRRPSSKQWYMRGVATLGNWGEPGDLAVAGNWN